MNRNIYHVFKLDINVPFAEAWFWALIEYTVVNRITCEHLIP